jgi:hypothetical protein
MSNYSIATKTFPGKAYSVKEIIATIAILVFLGAMSSVGVAARHADAGASDNAVELLVGP